MLQQKKPRKLRAARPVKRWHLWKQPRSLNDLELFSDVKVYKDNLWKDGAVVLLHKHGTDKVKEVIIRVDGIRKLVSVNDKINLLVPREP